MIYYIFYKTNDVFLAEEKMEASNICVEIVPTPVQDKAYCGVCIKIDRAEEARANKVLLGIEYRQIREA